MNAGSTESFRYRYPPYPVVPRRSSRRKRGQKQPTIRGNWRGISHEIKHLVTKGQARNRTTTKKTFETPRRSDPETPSVLVRNFRRESGPRPDEPRRRSILRTFWRVDELGNSARGRERRRPAQVRMPLPRARELYDRMPPALRPRRPQPPPTGGKSEKGRVRATGFDPAQVRPSPSTR